MANIINQLVLEYVNNQVCPLAQMLQTLTAKLNDAKNDWDGFISDIFALYVSEDVVFINRPSIPNPTKSEILQFLILANNLLSILENVGVPEAINKLCISPLSV